MGQSRLDTQYKRPGREQKSKKTKQSIFQKKDKQQ
jgi:hypothetical protein